MSAICRDCGRDTTPCTGKRGCRHKGKWEWYMVKPEVWAAAGMPRDRVLAYNETDGNYLCIRCVERRLGRELEPADFTDANTNEPDPWDTPLLAQRKGHAR